MIGRSIRKRAVGSTLLVKGLEAEVAIIIDTDVLSAKDLYGLVATTLPKNY